jgi:hypothetical protein
MCNKDVDEAAEPFMEQAKEALGDASSDDDADNPANPSLGDHQSRQTMDGPR